MKIKSGFIDLVSDNNKLSVLIENENERNSMGFSVLYDFFAEKLFPSVSTLMPNMVYCYLIYPLRQLYPIDSDINAALAKLTTAKPGGKKSLASAAKGFHGSGNDGKGIKENIIGTYRNFMIRYGYFEDDENTYLGKKNQELSNTKRYQRIHQIFAQKDITDVDQILSKTKISGEKISDALKHTLQSDEKKDLVLRMLYIFGIELGAEGFQLRQEYDVEQKPSLLELVCVVCLMNKANFEKIFGETQYYCSFKAVCVKLNCGELKFNIDRNCIKNKTFYHKYVFEKINTFFAVEQKSPGIEDLEDNNLKKQIELINNLITYYKIARFVSKTEYVIKDWSNQLIHNYNNLTGKYDIDGNVYCNYRKYLKDYLSAEEEMNFVISKLGVIKKENQQVGEKLEQLQAFIDMVKNENYHGAQHLVWNMRFSSTHVKENREFDMKELNMYVNTFRWEYRPQPSEENKWKEREMCKQSKQDGKKKLESKCASYFIYELFFE